MHVFANSTKSCHQCGDRVRLRKLCIALRVHGERNNTATPSSVPSWKTSMIVQQQTKSLHHCINSCSTWHSRQNPPDGANTDATISDPHGTREWLAWTISHLPMLSCSSAGLASFPRLVPGLFQIDRQANERTTTFSAPLRLQMLSHFVS